MQLTALISTTRGRHAAHRNMSLPRDGAPRAQRNRRRLADGMAEDADAQMWDRSSEGRSRLPAVAGTWYPDDAGELRDLVESLTAAAAATAARSDRQLRAIVVPHAGMRYSGGTAAVAFCRVRPGDFDRVIVLAPSHRVPLRGAVVDPSAAYATRWGAIPVDADAVRTLAGNGFAPDPRPFVPE